MEPLLAKAIYDNTAESSDELAFHKGDIVTVMDQKVAGSSGWWKCSLQGQEGLAPANRLALLSPGEAKALQDVYQTPKVTWPPTPKPKPKPGPLYEVMQVSPLAGGSPGPFTRKFGTPNMTDGKSPPSRMVCATSSPRSDVYDVPNLARKGSLVSVPSPRPLVRKTSLMPTQDIQKRYDIIDNSRSGTNQTNIYDVPPSLSQDPNYDIPMPSKSGIHQRVAERYSTMPPPRKSEWIYDVPVIPERPSGEHGHYGTMSLKGENSCKQFPSFLATVPACSLYDIPRPSVTVQGITNASKPEAESIYDVLPSTKLRGTLKETPPLTNAEDSNKPLEDLEYRGKSGPIYDCPRGRPSWGRKMMVPSQFQEGAVSAENEEEKSSMKSRLTTSDNQRSSTASTSSSSSRSSCDSLMLSSSSPEPLREVTLTQEDVSQRLLELQEMVCQSVPKLMEFVSSRWRSREHLGEHLEEIRTASEGIAHSVSCFVNFALEVKGNAMRLTDSNLQVRLLKQLSIVEDSGLILQQSVDALGGLGWPLDVLVQDPNQLQTPDQLERFVMVARTLPEDVKRLVSIINANSKLLFRGSVKEPETPKNASPADMTRSKDEPLPDLDEENNVYVQLQTKKEIKQQHQILQVKDHTEEGTSEENKKQPDNKPAPPTPPTPSASQSPSSSAISDHCRLYFGAIKKAITVLVGSLEEGQPPEKFITHGKLVIMVGQRLMDSLCREAQSRQDCQELLCKSNHMCALLKQLAVAIKKAALHFPDKVAIEEVNEFAMELCQWAQHFRSSLDS